MKFIVSLFFSVIFYYNIALAQQNAATQTVIETPTKTTKPVTAEPVVKKNPTATKSKPKKRVRQIFATLETSIDGKKLEPIKVRLYHRRAPQNVKAFVALAEGKRAYKVNKKTIKDKPFYDGLIFHRIIAGFMVQTGDPLGNGTGGPGFKTLHEKHPSLSHKSPGIMAMANAGKDRRGNIFNGSQFYITVKETKYLDEDYTIIGEVTEGLNSVFELSKVPVDRKNSRPKGKVVLEKVTILRTY